MYIELLIIIYLIKKLHKFMCNKEEEPLKLFHPFELFYNNTRFYRIACKEKIQF